MNEQATEFTYGTHAARAAADAADKTADQLSQAADAGSEMTKNILSQVAGKAAALRDSAGPAVDRFTSQVKDTARNSASTVRETAGHARDVALRANDLAVTYVQEQPMKAVLIAAATGAALMALAGLLARSSR